MLTSEFPFFCSFSLANRTHSVRLFAEESVKKAKTPFEHAKNVHGHVQSSSQRHHGRSHSYEIFNPETEDIDTDSSGVSTPDSVGSVISVKMDSSSGTPVIGKSNMAH